MAPAVPTSPGIVVTDVGTHTAPASSAGDSLSTPSPPLVATSTQTATSPASPTAEATAPPLPTASPTSGVSPIVPNALCSQEPPSDYARVEVNDEVINYRTLWMLQEAQRIYNGPGDLLRVTQGSYTDAEPGSFGTHSGGGAVDISLRNPTDPSEVLWEEVEPMITALRLAGFAAWYRAPGDLGPDSPAHIHAIAIGDQELSPAAIEQLTGSGGYFRGMDGLPPPLGPNPDRHGGPVICEWMLELGYDVLQP